MFNTFLKNGNFNLLKSNTKTTSIRKFKQNKKSRRGYVAMESPYSHIAGPKLETVNNLKVIMQEKPESSLLTLGITVQCGAVNETDNLAGIGRFISDIALEGPSSRGNFNLGTEIRNLGAQVKVEVDRENTSFIVRCFPKDVEAVMGILGDIVKNRDFSQRSLDSIVKKTAQEYDAVLNNMDVMMEDHLHAAAFQGTGLERSTFITDESLPNINSNSITKHMDTYYTAPGIILTAVGPINQAKILESANKTFNGLPQSKALIKSETDFVGSDVRIRDDDVPGLYAIFGLPGVSKFSEERECYTLLQELIGSCDTMFGGLDNNCAHLAEALVQERLVHNYHSFQRNYSNNGIIGVKGFFPVGNLELDTSSDFVLKEFQRVGKAMSESDLKRAKNVVISQILHQWSDDYALSKELGSRGFFEVNSLENTIARVQKVTKKDMKNITLELDDTCPVIVSFGKTEEFPDYTVLRNRTFWTLLVI